MKKKIIPIVSLIVALALTITAVNILPSLYEKYVQSSSDEDLVDAVEINEENFPDENFRTYLLNLEKTFGQGYNGDGIFDKNELAKVTSINVSTLDIKDLSGIEYFAYLEVLNCSGNSIESLDLSHNEKIKELNCSNNKIGSLDLSKQTDLTKVDCSFNNISELNIKEHPSLLELCCSNNPIKELDLSGNYQLWRFECSNTQLTSLNVEIPNPNESEFQIDFDYFEVNNSSYIALNCNKEAFDFDLTTLPGNFDIEKASNWNGAEPTGTILSGITNGTTVTYTYDVGRGLSVDFSITFQEGHNLIKIDDRSEICSTAAELWQCADCGRYFADEEAKTEAEVSSEHSYNEGVVEKPATCTEEGVLLKTCSVCGHEHREVIEMLPHNVDDKYEFDEHQHWKICHDCGQEIGREDHTFEGESDVCLVCGETIPRHHHQLEHFDEKAPTCSEEGHKEYYYCAGCEKYFTDSEAANEISYEELVIEKLAHQYEIKHNETQHWQECAVCGEKTEAEDHTFEDVRTEPTCCKDGLIATTCSVCQYVNGTEPIPATNEHSFGTEYSHDETNHWFNCTGEGCTEKKDISEHSYSKIEITKEPTCSEEGVMSYTCEACGYIKNEPIPKADHHTYSEEYVKVDEHKHAKVCTGCGITTDEGEHSFDIQIVEANCIEGGKMVYTCKQCGYSYFEQISEPTGSHSFSAEYTLDGTNHIHKCTAEGCTAKDVHDQNECSYGSHVISKPTETEPVETKPVETTPSETIPDETAPIYGVSNEVEINTALAEIPAIDIVWPTSAVVVFNPYQMNVKITEDSENHTYSFGESEDGSMDTVVSNELSFINNGDTELKITVTGSVSAVTTVDSNGNPLLDENGKPTTTASSKITIASDPAEHMTTDLLDIGTEAEPYSVSSILLYLEAATQLDQEQNGIYLGAYNENNKNQMLLTTNETTKQLFNIAPKKDGISGITNVKICGDIAAGSNVNWSELSKTDNIKISLVFDVDIADTASTDKAPVQTDTLNVNESAAAAPVQDGTSAESTTAAPVEADTATESTMTAPVEADITTESTAAEPIEADTETENSTAAPVQADTTTESTTAEPTAAE